MRHSSTVKSLNSKKLLLIIVKTLRGFDIMTQVTPILGCGSAVRKAHIDRINGNF